MDPAGNLLMALPYSNTVALVAAASGTFYGVKVTAGDIYAVTGSGARGFSGDGGPATSARLSVPQGADVDAAGNAAARAELNNPVGVGLDSTGDLLVTDTNSARLREIAR